MYILDVYLDHVYFNITYFDTTEGLDSVIGSIRNTTKKAKRTYLLIKVQAFVSQHIFNPTRMTIHTTAHSLRVDCVYPMILTANSLRMSEEALKC